MSNHVTSQATDGDESHSGKMMPRKDSFLTQSGDVSGRNISASKAGASWAVILQLAFQSIGVVYGDIGTSPLYVFASTFTDGIKHNDDILGVLSLIFYTLTLIPLIKYVFVVLRANDNGEGGTFALYSLICRYAKVSLIPNQQVEDRNVSNYKLELPNDRRLRRASRIKSVLENSHFIKLLFVFAAMLGTSMVIGDGVLTPVVSVLSAVSGIKVATPKITEDMTVWLSVAILILLFAVQRFGTDKIGNSFAPTLCVWFILNAGIGLYNIIKYEPAIVKALNPAYIVHYFQRNKIDAWISLGGVVLCTTGAEALFADVGHFSVRSIQVSLCCVTYPALVLTYTGQAAFLRKHNDFVAETFYKCIPGPLYWPMFVVAVLSSIIASQALISGTFSIVQQSLALGCFPRVKIVHTSAKHEGQIYIPEINYLLMVACVLVTIGFRTTTMLGNAYGMAVLFVMILTSSFLVLIMVLIWKTNILFVIVYVLTIGLVELLYLSAVLYKFTEGGYLPLAFATVLVLVMATWNSVYRKKYNFEVNHKISSDKLKEIVAQTNICRLPGLAVFYSPLVQGIPPIFQHYVENVPALHSVLVFVSIKSLPMSKVPVEERFLFRRVEPSELNLFRCVARYGYTDTRNQQEEPFEVVLVEKLKEFIRNDYSSSPISINDREVMDHENMDGDRNMKQYYGDPETEIGIIDKAHRAGIIHFVGTEEVTARKGAGWWNRFVINYAYDFLRKNVRQSDKLFDIPHQRKLKVGMTYEL